MDVTNDSFTVTWTQDPRAISTTDFYIVEYKPATVGWSSARSQRANTTRAVITGLMMGTTYEVRIITVNANGMSEPSLIIRITTDGKWSGRVSDRFLVTRNNQTLFHRHQTTLWV